MLDLIIIGGGPGGYVAALRARQLGMSTAIMDRKGEFGGTCLWRGCIPTKAFLHVARYLEETRRAQQWGVKAQAELEMEGLQRFKTRIVGKHAKGIQGLLDKNGVQIHIGEARLLDGRRVQAGERVLEASHILIATGSSPASLPHVSLDGAHVLSSDHALELKVVPTKVLILGAGAIGVEFASIFRAFGAEVTLFEILPRVLPLEEPWASEELDRSLKRRGIRVNTGAKVTGWVQAPSGVKVLYEKDGKASEEEGGFILSAVGRAPNTGDLGLDRLHIQLTSKKTVPVNDFFQTSVPGVYAIGDILSSPMLAHVASHEGIIAVEHMAGLEPHPMNYGLVPSCTYSLPEVASVGLKTAEAQAQGRTVRTGRFPFSASPKASAMGENEGGVFVVRDGLTDELLGMTIVGPHATELIMEGGAALHAELTCTDLSHLVHPHPTLTEALAEANLDALGRAIHL
jgi:dihydrolipoamide dehydrogenase